MAVGDVVSGIAAAGIALTFQPAATIECVIKSCGMSGVAQQPNITNGVTSGAFLSDGLNGRRSEFNNMSVFINNTNYFTIPGNAGVNVYSGIQIK